MKTDNLFYELFRLQPRSLLELAKLDLQGRYEFESVTLKSTEKRLDGLFRRVDGTGPNLFLEVQGYDDPAIYWRLLREISTWYEQGGNSQPFVAIVLFLEPKYDPGRPDWIASERLLVLNLESSLKALCHQASRLTVLKPLVTPKRQILKQASRWQAELQSLQLPKKQERQLIELLEYAILQRLPNLTLEEIERMLHLTPLEQTVAVRQLMAKSLQQGLDQGLTKGVKQGLAKGVKQGLAKGVKQGLAKGVKQGLEQGELIGKIQLAQRILKRQVTSKPQLFRRSLSDLKQLLTELESQL